MHTGVISVLLFFYRSSQVDQLSLLSLLIAEAIRFIRMVGLGTLLLKVDLKRAYHIVPVHPIDRHLFSLCWEGQAYVDQAYTLWPQVSIYPVHNSGRCGNLGIDAGWHHIRDALSR